MSIFDSKSFSTDALGFGLVEDALRTSELGLSTEGGLFAGPSPLGNSLRASFLPTRVWTVEFRARVLSLDGGGDEMSPFDPFDPEVWGEKGFTGEVDLDLSARRA